LYLSRELLISDPTLRDGNHAVRHQLTERHISTYARAAERAGIPFVEVGHGNGLGASSIQVGRAAVSDLRIISAARSVLHTAKLTVHAIPGFATVARDVAPALAEGVDVVRAAAHCTEADLTARHIDYVRNQSKTAFGVLMMSHMADAATLAREGSKLVSYGAQAVILMDSAGALLPGEVRARVAALRDSVPVPVGFHAHNNLGLAIANSVAAADAGASIIDGTACGFGAGAGNAQLEVLVPVLGRHGYSTQIDLYRLLDCADMAEKELLFTHPRITSEGIVSGLSGVFSGFASHVARAAAETGVDSRDIWFELGRRRTVAGQEDLIIEVATTLHGTQERPGARSSLCSVRNQLT
jgi:4-hydroxy 2-oxovalerate aldolase